MIDREQTADRIEFIGERDELANRTIGKRISSELGLIMLRDRTRHLRSLPCCLGIVGAHDALHRGEFHDRIRNEVSLTKIRCALGVSPIGLIEIRFCSKMIDQRYDTVGLIEHGAELLLEYDLIKRWNIRFERLLEVFVVEELRIIEAGTYHALVTIDDGFREGGVAIGDHDELVRKLTLCIVEREIALVHEHRIDDDLFRNGQELFVESTHHSSRVFGQVHDLHERLLRKLCLKTCFSLDRTDLLANERFTLRVRRNDLCRAHYLKQLICIRDRKGTWRHETMPHRLT